MLGGLQNLSVSLGEEKNTPCPSRESNPLTVHTIALKYIKSPLKKCRILRQAVLTVTDVL
jgi:hypothetical protein